MIKNFLKRCLIVSALAIGCFATSLACGPYFRPHYYVFSAYHRNQMGNVFTDRMNQFWFNYAPEVKESPWNISNLGSVQDEGFDNTDNPIVKAAIAKNDKEMQDYLRLLTKYINICDGISDSWEYPTKEELAQRDKDLRYINNRARSYGGTRLAGQYCLLVMRTMMVQGDNNGNIAYWNEHKDKLSASVYKDMMKDIYAGALLNTGKTAEASQIYYELGDMASLRWIMRNDTNLEGLKKEYKRDPNSPTLIYLVQELTNVMSDTRYCIVKYEVVDGDENRKEINDFITFAEKVLKDGKTQCPALWQSAIGWLNHSLGNSQKGIDQLDKAMKMKGTDRMRDNARVCRLVATADYEKPSNKLYAFLKEEMQWMTEREKAEASDAGCSYCTHNHYTEVLENMVFESMGPTYVNNGNVNVGVAMMGWLTNHTGNINDFKNEEFKDAIDCLTADDMMSFYKYQNSTPATEFEAWLLEGCEKISAERYNDMVGTKYIRQGQFAEAKPFLEKVSLKYLSSQAIAPYAAARSYKVEQCYKWQHETNDSENLKLKRNQKLDFVNDMLKMMAKYESLSQGGDKAYAAYQIANYYFQASYKGNCWYLSRYGNSVNDTVCYKNEKDFIAEAAHWYQLALDQPGIPASIKQSYLYAAAYLPFGQPYTTYYYDEEYNEHEVINKDSYQYKRLSELQAFAARNRNTLAPFISNCDVLKRFTEKFNL